MIIKTLEDLRKLIQEIIGQCPHDWSLDDIEMAIYQAIEFWRDREEEKKC